MITQLIFIVLVRPSQIAESRGRAHLGAWLSESPLRGCFAAWYSSRIEARLEPLPLGLNHWCLWRLVLNLHARHCCAYPSCVAAERPRVTADGHGLSSHESSDCCATPATSSRPDARIDPVPPQPRS